MPKSALLFLALLLTGAQATATFTAAVPATPPPLVRYCAPIAYRDYEVLVGRAAAVQPAPTCTQPSRIRKVSTITGKADPALTIYAPSYGTPPTRIWLFVSRLEYSLDGRTWQRLAVR